MRYVLTFPGQLFHEMVTHLSSTPGLERAAFLFGRLATTTATTTILVQRMTPVSAADIESASSVHMSIRSQAYRRALKDADATGQCFLFAHSHPPAARGFSSQDDREEAALFRTAYVRIHHDTVHGSLVLPDPTTAVGRVWLPDGTYRVVERIRIIGERFQYLYPDRTTDEHLEYFDRQARAFTSVLQPVLKRLHVGIVGVGGTGSAVCEQLIRLGVGTLTVVDSGVFEASNVSRVYGSGVYDEALPKVNVTGRLAATIGLGTTVNRVHGHLSYKSVARQLLECDILFGCTDDEWGRSILNRLALWYHLPVFDMGVQIDTDGDTIRSIQGRVTTLVAGAACLFCRHRISVERVRAAAVSASNPEEAARLRR